MEPWLDPKHDRAWSQGVNGATSINGAATHPRNLAARPQVSIMIFYSLAPVGSDSAKTKS